MSNHFTGKPNGDKKSDQKKKNKIGVGKINNEIEVNPLLKDDTVQSNQTKNLKEMVMRILSK